MQTMETIGAFWFNAIAMAALKATLILAAAGVIAELMRDRSPAVRFRVWVGALLCAAALPLFSLVTPDLPWLPSWLNADAWLASAPPLSGEVANPAASPGLAILLAISVIVWSIGFAWRFGRAVLSAALLGQVAKRSRKLPESHRLTQLCRDLQARQGIRGRVNLYTAPGDARPLAWGVASSRLLLPESAADWSDARAEAVLIHELEHVRRRDALIQILEQAVCSIYWFHPLVWWCSDRLRFEREAACDDAVLSAGIRPTDYAESLLELSHPNSHAWRAPMLAAPIAETRALPRRIREILSATRVRNRLTWLQAASAVIVFAALLTVLSSLKPAPATENTPSTFAVAAPVSTPPDFAPSIADTLKRQADAQREAFAARVYPDPSPRPFVDRADWTATAELLGATATVDAVEDASSALERLDALPSSPNEPTLSLDDLKVESARPMPQSPTDTHGRVSQAAPHFGGVPMTL